ncbi:hypothetical protein DLAC_05013 [Tieghemostelium lacteum]|uniref:ATPase AAA-type core domain-containing protein n=1 Tax=Tieghemostelium lacteum TaxID=361077 RepID=A0A151ZI07_TIELA|nr:hypothetical protein DLAC_05013 [Tieghemostelium lacteum]|eukprot:KYQ93631.1 hypothetical protein DLAC_05013 [Tieghemostelium lacteum]
MDESKNNKRKKEPKAQKTNKSKTEKKKIKLENDKPPTITTRSNSKINKVTSPSLLSYLEPVISIDSSDVSSNENGNTDKSYNSDSDCSSSKDSPPKPLHPFFSKQQDQVKKKKQRDINQKTLQDKLQNNSNVAEMFLSKEEKDKLAFEKSQHQFRLDIIKSHEDHAKMNAGKPIHPFFLSTPSSNSSTISNGKNSNGTSKSPIDLDDYETPSSQALCNQKTFILPEFPNEPYLCHVNWVNSGFDEIVHQNGIIDVDDSDREKVSLISENRNDIKWQPKIEKYSKEEKLKRVFNDYHRLLDYDKNLVFSIFEDEFKTFENTYNKKNSGNSNSSLICKYYSPENNVFVDNQEIIEYFDKWLGKWKTKQDNRKLKDSQKKKKKMSKKVKSSSSLVNSLLIIGDIGAGKTSLVYSKTEEYGFTVLESNSSYKRSGKCVQEMYGEATQSRNLSTQDKDTLVLFDEIDIIYEEDKGFFSALTQLISNSKIPLVMTCNQLTTSIEQLVLDSGLISLYMKKPVFTVDLFVYLSFVMVSEDINPLPSSEDLMNFIHLNNNDLRKCLNSLDFYRKSQNPIVPNAFGLAYWEFSNHIDQMLGNLFEFQNGDDLYFNNYLQQNSDMDIDQIASMLDTMSLCNVIVNRPLNIRSINDNENYQPILDSGDREQCLLEQNGSIQIPDQWIYNNYHNYYTSNDQNSIRFKVAVEISNLNIKEFNCSFSIQENQILKYFSSVDSIIINNPQSLTPIESNTQRNLLDRFAMASRSLINQQEILHFVNIFCLNEQERKSTNAKRNNRFYHYLNLSEEEINLFIKE